MTKRNKFDEKKNKSVTDQQTDRPTYRRTVERTKRGVQSRAMNKKKGNVQLKSAGRGKPCLKKNDEEKGVVRQKGVVLQKQTH